MPISVKCKCQKRFIAKDEYAGRKIKCPACGETLVIPHAAPTESVKPAVPTEGPKSPGVPSTPIAHSPAIAPQLPPMALPVPRVMPVAMSPTMAPTMPVVVEGPPALVVAARRPRHKSKATPTPIVLIGIALATIVVLSIFAFFWLNGNRLFPGVSPVAVSTEQSKKSTSADAKEPSLEGKGTKQSIAKPIAPPRTDTPEILALVKAVDDVDGIMASKALSGGAGIELSFFEVAIVLTLIQEPLNCIYALELLGTAASAAEPALVRTTNDSDKVNQLFAAHALALVRGNDAEAEQVLKDGVKNSDRTVSVMAKLALEEWRIKHRKPE